MSDQDNEKLMQVVRNQLALKIPNYDFSETLKRMDRKARHKHKNHLEKLGQIFAAIKVADNVELIPATKITTDGKSAVGVTVYDTGQLVGAISLNTIDEIGQLAIELGKIANYRDKLELPPPKDCTIPLNMDGITNWLTIGLLIKPDKKPFLPIICLARDTATDKVVGWIDGRVMARAYHLYIERPRGIH